MLRFLQRHFLTGLLALSPLAITSWILWRFYVLVSGTMRPWLQRVPSLTEAYPDFFLTLIGAVVVFCVIVMVGLFTRNVIGGAFFRMLDRFFIGIPVVKSVFSATKQIASVFLQDRRTAFKKVVLFSYPRPGIFSLGFTTHESVDADLVSVFLPTTPNPTSGYMLLLPRSQVQELELSVEEAIKLVVSGGAIMTPDQVAQISTGLAALPGLSTRPGITNTEPQERMP